MSPAVLPAVIRSAALWDPIGEALVSAWGALVRLEWKS